MPDIHTRMSRGVFTAATGMIAAERSLDAIAHNLANASTVGFKREGLSFEDGLVREMRSNGGMGGRIGSMGSGAIVRTRFTDFSVGSQRTTGNPLDVAIQGEEGMFAVRTPAGDRYTRSGSFTLDERRNLITRDGFSVLDEVGQAINVPPGEVAIAPNGEVLSDGAPIARLGVFKAQFERAEGGLFRAADTPSLEFDAAVNPGNLETSNVESIEEMVAMIKLNRAYELAQKSIQSQDEATGRLIQSLEQR